VKLLLSRLHFRAVKDFENPALKLIVEESSVNMKVVAKFSCAQAPRHDGA
jgi:hypothetical protein